MTDLNLIENTPAQDQSLAVEMKNELSGSNVSPVFWWPKYEAAKKAGWIWNFGGSPLGASMKIRHVNPAHQSSQMTDLHVKLNSRMFQRLSIGTKPLIASKSIHHF